MVNLTIYVEGNTSVLDNLNPADISSLTFDNSATLREGFYELFSQEILPEKYNLIIDPIGSISQAKKHLTAVSTNNSNAIILIDLDGPPSEKQKRIDDNFKSLDVSRIFFMVQEMESWILSQPDKIEFYASTQLLKREHSHEEISDNSLIKNKTLEEIENPTEKLNQLFRRYFKFTKVRQGKLKQAPRSYHKTKDGPKLVGLLNLSELKHVFSDVQNLLDYINSTSQTL